MTLSHLIGLTCWEQGCGQDFLGDSPRSPRPCDLLACQLASRREDHGQVSIIMSVILDDGGLCNVLDTIVDNSPKQTPFHLFLDTALKTSCLRVQASRWKWPVCGPGAQRSPDGVAQSYRQSNLSCNTVLQLLNP